MTITKTASMKKLLLLTCLMGSCSLSFGQDHIQIKSIGQNYSAQTIQAEFETADLCGLEYETKRFQIIFDDGSVVEIKSALEMNRKNGSCVLEDNTKPVSCTYRIASNTIIKEYKYEESDQRKKVNLIKH